MLNAPRTRKLAVTEVDASSLESLRDVVWERILRAPECAASTTVERVKLAISQLEHVLNGDPQLQISLSDVSLILGLERTYCCTLFRSAAGETYSAWIRRIRIATARELLRKPELSVTDVAFNVGYSDITTFERNFRRQVGVCPSEFRRMARSGRVHF